MTVDDVLKGKGISVHEESDRPTITEFKDLSEDVTKFLEEKMSYKEELAGAVKDGASAIQQQPTLDPKKVRKFDVASTRTSKHGRVECTVNQQHVTCRCPNFKSDKVCKHSIAVAEKVGMLHMHLKFIQKGSSDSAGSRTALAEGYTDKAVAGKKGSVNKCRYRPSPSPGQHQQSNRQRPSNPNAQRLYTELHHNDTTFVLLLLPKEAQMCKQCKQDFCHRQRIVPFDLVFAHKERYFFPIDGDWKRKQASNREATRYYHTDPKCIGPCFPYFISDYIEIPTGTKNKLVESHKVYLRNQFSLCI